MLRFYKWTSFYFRIWIALLTSIHIYLYLKFYLYDCYFRWFKKIYISSILFSLLVYETPFKWTSFCFSLLLLLSMPTYFGLSLPRRRDDVQDMSGAYRRYADGYTLSSSPSLFHWLLFFFQTCCTTIRLSYMRLKAQLEWAMYGKALSNPNLTRQGNEGLLWGISRANSIIGQAFSAFPLFFLVCLLPPNGASSPADWSASLYLNRLHLYGVLLRHRPRCNGSLRFIFYCYLFIYFCFEKQRICACNMGFSERERERGGEYIFFLFFTIFVHFLFFSSSEPPFRESCNAGRLAVYSSMDRAISIYTCTGRQIKPWQSWNGTAYGRGRRSFFLLLLLVHVSSSTPLWSRSRRRRRREREREKCRSCS